MITSLSSSAQSSLAIYGLNQATNQITSSTYKLSTGDRFYRAGDDVAALSTATKLQSQITGLRQGLLNNSQANSVLQVAYSGLSEIGSILDEMKTLAVQGNSGSLTAVERATLNLQFQNLRDSVDSIANGTNFNNIKLLDGSVSQENDVLTSQNNATQSTGSITLTANPGAGNTFRLNGSTVIANTHFTIGATTADTATNLANYLNTTSDRNLSSATYEAVGTTINITAKAGGVLGDQYQINQSGSTASFTTVGQNTDIANTFALQGGQDDGLFMGGTVASGTIGDALINTQNQTVASQTLTILDNSLLDNNEGLLQVDDGAGGTITFRMRTATIAAPEDFLQGATAEETLQNLVSTIKNYSTNSDHVLNQLDYKIEGSTLTISGKVAGNVLDQNGAVANVSETAATNEAFLSNTTLNNGVNTGVNTDGVVNAAFVGTISGFSATYNSANNITASVTVGSETYTADITNTNLGANTFTRFSSTNGGYFDVELSGGNGMVVASQSDANTYSSRLNAAFSTLTFAQTREVSNFTGSGQLAGGSAQLRLDNFTDTRIEDISVSAPPTAGQNATIDVTIDGQIFRSNALGASIGANETITLTNLSNGNEFLRITSGDTAIDLSDATAASTFEETLRSNFDLGNGDGALTFQIGNDSGDILSVSIGSATSDSLFDGADPDVSTQVGAIAAESVIDAAIDELSGIIAEVGSKQSALDFAYNANNSAVNELEQARSILADTDIPSESSIYAAAVVKQQASIAVLAQTQALSSNLLDLLTKN